MRSASNIARHELIGIRVRTDSSDGKVIDETRNVIIIEKDGSEKKIPKENTVFSFYIPETDEWVKVDGKVLLARPEDRVKKKLEKW